MTDLTEASAEEEKEVLFQHFRAFGTESLGLKAVVVEHLGCLLILFCLCHFFKDSPFLMQLLIFRHHTGRLAGCQFLLCSALNEESRLLISCQIFFVKTFFLIGEPSLFYTATAL